MNKADWNSWRITGIPGELLEFLENYWNSWRITIALQIYTVDFKTH
jgi:hypothetical protein